MSIMTLEKSSHHIVIEGGRVPMWDIVSWKDGEKDLMRGVSLLYTVRGVEGIRRPLRSFDDARPDMASGRVRAEYLADDETIEVACVRQKRTGLADFPVPEGFELIQAIVQRPDGIWQTVSVFVGGTLRLLNGIA